MTNADGPGSAAFIQAAQIEIAASIDDEVLEGHEIARGRIYGEAFRDSAKVERQRAAQGNGASIGIQFDIAIADIVIAFGCVANEFASAVFAIEAARLHAMAD